VCVVLESTLVDIAVNVSARDKIKESRRIRWLKLAMSAKLLPDFRVAYCLRRVSDNHSTVDICFNPTEHRAYYKGLMTCGSPWVCPICAEKIAYGRREELTRAVKNWNGALIFLTLTLQHNKSDDLKSLLSALKDSYRRLKSGRAWLRIKEKYGLSAYVSSLEITYGENGWHPHEHVILFSTLPESKFDINKFKTEIQERYLSLLAENDKYGSEYHSIDIRIGDKFAADYVSKFGIEQEIIKSASKRARHGLTAFQLLELAMEPDQEQAGKLFQEYAYATFGLRQITWSHGAREIFGLEAEREDNELAAEQEQEQDITLLSLTKEQWYKVVKAELRYDLLEIGSSGDSELLWSFLNLKIGLAPP